MWYPLALRLGEQHPQLLLLVLGLSGVDAHVPLEVAALLEPGRAELARERLLPSVSPGVGQEDRLEGEGFVAEPAVVRCFGPLLPAYLCYFAVFGVAALPGHGQTAT